LQIVYRKISDLKKYEKNNKKHPEKQIEKIVASIKEYGFKNPVLIDKNDVIISGHGRTLAAERIGMQEVPCIDCSDLNAKQVKALRLMDNKSAELAEWDFDNIKAELEELKLEEFDIDLTGFEFELDLESGNKENDEKQDPRDYMNLDKFYPKTVGKYGMPLIRKCDIDDIELIGFNYARTSQEKQKFLHFFLDDYQFYRVWNELKGNGEIIKEFAGALSPDFSLYSDYPISLQIYNTYRNRYCGAYWQSLGIKVIPTIGWSDERSFDFCFEGVEKGGVVAVGTVGVMNDENAKKLFLKGYNEMMKRLEPKKIIIYGSKFEGLIGDIIEIKPFYNKFRGDK
jgi:hypothetical protein